LWPAGLAAHVIDERANAIAVAHGLTRQHFVASHDRLAAAEIDHHVAIFDALHDTVDDIADAILVLLILPVALGLAHFLHDHLFGGLRSDAAVLEWRQGIGGRVGRLRRRTAP